MVKDCWNKTQKRITSIWVLLCLLGTGTQIPAEDLSYDLNTSVISKDAESSVKSLIANDCAKYGHLQATKRTSVINGPYLSIGISNDKTSVSLQLDFAKLDPNGETSVGNQKLRTLTTVNYYIAEWDKLSAADQTELITSFLDSSLKIILSHYNSSHTP